MLKYAQLFFLTVLLISCTENYQHYQPVESPPWQSVRSGIDFGISGMALVSQENNQSDFLIVHDNKQPGENRLAILTVSPPKAPEYLPLIWPKDPDLPKDLEAITTVPGTTPTSFMAATSKGQIYHLTIGSDRNISILKVFDLPEFPENSNFEGLALQKIGDRLLMVWAHRGQDRDPGEIYWGTLDLNNYQISPQGSVKFTVPWPTDKVRHISDIKIDPAGNLYITSATDPGDDGPFTSAVYIAGVFSVSETQFQFESNSKLEPVYRFEDHKIEGIELIPGVKDEVKNGFIFGTDDENMGSSIYTSF